MEMCPAGPDERVWINVKVQGADLAVPFFKDPLRELECVTCYRSFSLKSSVGRHYAMVHMRLRFRCPLCLRPYGTRRYVLDHIDKCTMSKLSDDEGNAAAANLRKSMECGEEVLSATLDLHPAKGRPTPSPRDASSDASASRAAPSPLRRRSRSSTREGSATEPLLDVESVEAEPEPLQDPPLPFYPPIRTKTELPSPSPSRVDGADENKEDEDPSMVITRVWEEEEISWSTEFVNGQHVYIPLDKNMRQRCVGCEKVFSSVRYLKAHYISSHLGIAHMCPICGDNFPFAAAYRHHRVFAHSPRRGPLPVPRPSALPPYLHPSPYPPLPSVLPPPVIYTQGPQQPSAHFLQALGPSYEQRQAALVPNEAPPSPPPSSLAPVSICSL